MNGNYRKFSCRSMRPIIGLLLLMVASMRIVLGGDQDVAPKDLIFSSAKLIQILNSQNLPLLGTLARPDLTEKEAIKIYLDNNPSIYVSSPQPLPADSRYVSSGFKRISSNVWLSQYGQLYALWIHKNGLWYMKGCGLPESLAYSEARKYVHSDS